MTTLIGKQLGNYRLTHLLGQGGFAEVYLGEHIHLGTQAAIKVLLLQMENTELQEFRNEARLVAQLRHPHIIRILDFGVEGATPYLVMDYAPNGSLRQRFPRGGPQTLANILPAIKEIAAALQYAHYRKIIHRDVKPDNLLLGLQNEVLLSDFGIAVVAQKTATLVTQNSAGTPAYMAPEQLQGKPNTASDQYALGIVVYEWLCGSLPFTGTAFEVMYQHASTPPPSLQEKVPSIAPEVEQVVLKALSKDPSQRFTSVQAFAKALEQANQPQQPPRRSISTNGSGGDSVSRPDPVKRTSLNTRLHQPAIPPTHQELAELFSNHLVVPNQHSPENVRLAQLLGKEFLPVANGTQVIQILLEAKPTGLMATERVPLSVALVLDNSGSTRGPKLRKIREAAKMVIDYLEPTDYISLIIFDDTSQVIIPSMPTNDKPGMKAAIDKIQDAGGTTMSLGMIQGLGELRRWDIPNAIKRMILLTDGVTYGDTDRCRQLARDAALAGVSINTLGIGADWDESMLTDIAQLSGGTGPHLLENPEDMVEILEQQVQSESTIVVRNAVLTLRSPTGVAFRKAVKVSPIIQYIDPSALSDHQVVIPLEDLKIGDLKKDTAQYVLIELVTNPRPPGRSRIVQAKLTYDVPITGIVGANTYNDIFVTFTDDANQVTQINTQVMNFIERALDTANKTGGIICDECGFENLPSAKFCVIDGKLLKRP